MATKRSDGRYVKTFMYDGKRYSVYSVKKSDLDDKVARKKEELSNRSERHKNPTLFEYYADFKKIRKNKVKPSTIRNQQNWFNNVANMEIRGIKLGDIQIKDIKPADMKVIQQTMIDCGNLSTSSINDFLHHVSHVFEEAVKDETIERNPCKCLSAIKRTEEKARNTKHRALTKEETLKFIEAAEKSFFVNAFKLMLNTGMRMGELGALTFGDCDGDFIVINKTVSRNEKGAYIVNNTTKTDSSTRNIIINKNVRKIIEEQKALVRKTFGLRFNSRLFPEKSGAILRDYTFNREIKRITDSIGIDPVTSHAFRATFATRFIEQRPQDYKVLQEILGHADIKITLELYTHVMEAQKQSAMNDVIVI